MRTLFRTVLVLGLLSTPAFAGDAKAPAKTTEKADAKAPEAKPATDGKKTDAKAPEAKPTTDGKKVDSTAPKAPAKN